MVMFHSYVNVDQRVVQTKIIFSANDVKPTATEVQCRLRAGALTSEGKDW
jgi:hypothetical protein